MLSLTLGAVLQLSIAATGTQTYGDAYQKTSETGRPLVIMVGADWCPACVKMKQSILPKVERSGGLKDVAFAYVNTDQQSSLASKLTGGGSIPQLIVYRKTAKGWTKQKMVGAHSPDAVKSFIGHKKEVAKAAKPKTERKTAAVLTHFSEN